MHILPPKFDKARKLSMLELNGFKASDAKHTVITPALLEKMARDANSDKISKPDDISKP